MALLYPNSSIHDNLREAYDYQGFCLDPGTPQTSDETGEHIVFPLQARNQRLIMDIYHSRALQDAVSLAHRLLQLGNSDLEPVPFVIVDQRLREDDGVIDPIETGTVRVTDRHVLTAGKAFYRSTDPKATPEVYLSYQRHVFLLGVILAQHHVSEPCRR